MSIQNKIKISIALSVEKAVNRLGKTINFDHPNRRFPMIQTRENGYHEVSKSQIISHSSTSLNQFKYVQIGSGTNLAPGYLNIDINDLQDATISVSKDYQLDRQESLHYFKHDMRNGMPTELQQLRGIYSCHFLEHLNKDDGTNFLRDSFNRLAPGGLFRVVVPDFEFWAKAYIHKRKRFLTWYQRNHLANWDIVTSECTILNGMIYNYGHACMYDFKTMKSKLSKLGFANIKKRAWSNSNLPNMKCLENSLNYHQYESLLVECKKP